MQRQLALIKILRVIKKMPFVVFKYLEQHKPGPTEGVDCFNEKAKKSLISTLYANKFC